MFCGEAASEALEMVEDAFLAKYQPAPGHCRGHTHFGIRCGAIEADHCEADVTTTNGN